MSHSGNDLVQIQQAILAGYTRSELRVVLRSCMDENLDALVSATDFSDQVFQLVEWAERRGCLSVLVGCVCDGNQKNPALQKLAAQWNAADTAAQSTPSHSRRWSWVVATAVLGLVAIAVLIGMFVRPFACIAYVETGGTVVIEAEHFTSQERGRAHSSGEAFRSGVDSEWRAAPGLPGMMQALGVNEERNTRTEANGPALLYPIDFQTPGTYSVYVRGFGVNDDNDSIHVGLDGNPVTSVIENGYGIPEDSRPLWASRDGDGNPVTIDVAPGRHTLYIWMRENGVVLDKLWLDTGADKVEHRNASPGPPESPCEPLWRSWLK